MNRNNNDYEAKRPAPDGRGRPPQTPHPQQGQRAQQAPAQPPRRPRRKKSEYRVFRALAITVALVVLCVFMAYFALQSAGDLLGLDINVFGLRQEDKQVTVTVPEGSGVNDIAKALKDAGVIDSTLAFRLYSGFKDMDELYKPGEYILNCKMSYDQIMTALSTGSKERQDVVEVLFREGLTLREMGNLLEENGVCTSEEFVTAMRKGDYEYNFAKHVPQDRPLRFTLLEGYAFPDTYQFFVGEEPESVARKFLANFESKMTDEMYARMDEIGMSLDEVVTFASIVEKEASFGNAGELQRNMEDVAGVFMNRLNTPGTFPQLQSDVTIFYVERSIKPFLTTQNQAMYDAYNTYQCAGLPVGPICNPGLAAINAVLYPTDSEYYYFITDEEGKFYYATTLEEHEQNIYTASKIGVTGGTTTE